MDDRIVRKIERAADEIVLNRGARGWSMNDCADQAGITKRTLYRYVKTKEVLIENVLLRFIRGVQKELSVKLENEPEFMNGINIILNIFPTMIIKFNSRIIQSVLNEFPDIEKTLIKERFALASEAIMYIERGQRDGYITKDCEASEILEILQSLIIYYMNTDTPDIESKLKRSFSLVLNGILTRESVGED